MTDWQDMDTAPRTGEEIEGLYDGGQTSMIFWSDNPVCMLGRRCGSFPPGWATGMSGDCDYNLPMDAPLKWRPLQ